MSGLGAKGSNMESFNLDTAVKFLPVMDDTEDVTKQLISSIKMYNSLLDEKSKPLLLNFILSTRLSSSAKVRLSKNYKTVDHLVNDMSQYLLTKKSFIAIQNQLSQCTQNEKTIDAYGKEIENLFVELTIAQADGVVNKQKLLAPINEKMAINRFATGLRNKNLSTIVLARNYKTLKNAIQGAKDEEVSMAASNVKNDNKPLPQQNIFNSSRGRGQFQGRGGQGSQGNTRGGNHSITHHNQSGNKADSRDGNNHSQRGTSHCSRGNFRGSNPTGTHNHNQGNRSGHHSGSHQTHAFSGKNDDYRDGNKNNQSHRGNSQCSRGNRGAQSGNHQNQAAGKNFDNRDGHSQSQRGHSRGSNQRGTYHNQANRGGNHHANPTISVAVPAFQVDCQFRFTATSGGTNVRPTNTHKNSPGPNIKQLARK